jgi:outer membrane protein OmpA-like peptidoglycan-associated protein
MMRTTHILSAVIAAASLAGCATSPDTIEELQSARTLVSQVEASPRAGVAANHIAAARKALDQANEMAERGRDSEDIRYQATVASKHAQIANEKILTAQAREDIEKGQAERQAVLVEAREREARRRAADAEQATRRADMLEQELSDLRARKTDRGVVVTLGDVLFDTAQSTLKPGAYRTIDRLAEVMQEDQNRRVVIEGHTDSVGDEAYNQALSERRAQAVQAALLERGVSSDQISTVGKGETMPVASNDNAGGRQQNRRVELIFANEPDRTRIATEAD